MMASKQVSGTVHAHPEPGTYAERGRSWAAPAGQAATGTCPTPSTRSTEGKPVCSSWERLSRHGTRPSNRTSSASSSMISSSEGRASRSEYMFFSRCWCSIPSALALRECVVRRHTQTPRQLLSWAGCRVRTAQPRLPWVIGVSPRCHVIE